MSKYLLIIILVIAAVLRLVALDSYPVGLNADEAALGYNAYSLMLTGRDEHGHFLPLHLESFGDFKPALYAYLLIPVIKVFGLTEFAVRLPSALAGIAAVWLIYKFTKQLINENCALITALLLAIMPWHIHFSRGGWEVNLAATFFLAGLYLFVSNRLKTSLVLFCLTLYTYQSTRLITPVFGLMLGWFYLRHAPKQIIISLSLVALLLSPLALSLLRNPNISARATGVGLLADAGPVNLINELRGQHSNWSSLLAKVSHNRPEAYFVRFLSNYTDHFSGDFLFINGDVIQRNRVPETGLLYIVTFPLIVFGIYYLIRNPTVYSKTIWLWLLVAPLAAAFTFQTPHALRAHMLVFPLTILAACGLYQLSQYKYKNICYLLFAICIAFEFTRYLHQYYVHYPQTYPAAWQAKFDELNQYVQLVQSNYDQVLITDKYDQPYIIFLFYSKYPPQLFHTNHELTVRDRFNFSTVRSYDKYRFVDTAWSKVSDIHSSLIVAAPEDIPEVGVNVVKTIYFPGGQPAFKIISN